MCLNSVSNLVPNVKVLGCKSVCPSLRICFSLGRIRSSFQVKAETLPLVREFIIFSSFQWVLEYAGVWDSQMDQVSGSSVTLPVCSSAAGDQIVDKVVFLPVSWPASPYLWSQAEVSDQKNKVQAVEISFLCRDSGIIFLERMMGWTIWASE